MKPSVSIVTIGELHHGVEAASDDLRRRQRQRTLDAQMLMTVRSLNQEVARVYGHLAAQLPRKIGAADRWIAATAVVHQCRLVTFDHLLAKALAGLRAFDNWSSDHVLLFDE